ncbi:MAG: ferritin-like domain-containing protein [Alphaproteobacteria bacterium]|nr:ferritin-like domain-containing protein [Alphaproteobacteria bacterium]
MPKTLAEAAIRCLLTADAVEKARVTREMAAAWRSGAIAEIGDMPVPDRPGRPDRPRLLPPGQVPKRKITRGVQGRTALLHALAHIELNAVDLAWDLAVRFPDAGMPRDFHSDWVQVADDEARHFLMLEGRLNALGARYGDLDAHDGLWESAMGTAGDLLARLAIVPMVLEARGLDVTPQMIGKLEAAEDLESAKVLSIIYRDEIAHVAAGRRWFGYEADRRGLDHASTWRNLVKTHFKGQLKPPFNDEARLEAGLTRDFYGFAEEL